MPIIDAICEADSEHEIYFLLTAYSEAVRYCDKLVIVPEGIATLPFSSVDDLKIRLESLRAAFGETNGHDHAIIREAIEIVCAAIERLEALAGEAREMPMAA